MRKHSITLFFVIATSPASAWAANGTGPYVELGAGTAWANALRLDVATTPNPTAGGIIVKHKTGKDLSVAIGHDFGFFRVEAELAERDAKPSSIITTVNVPLRTLTGATAPVVSKGTFTPTGGRSMARSAMLNIFAQTGNPEVTRFYVGAGVGYARTYTKGYALSATAEVLRDHDQSKAWQLLAGAREPIGEHVTLGVRYRYFHPEKAQLTDTLNRAVSGRLVVHGIQATLGYRF